MSCFSIAATILDVNVFHCSFTPEDDRVEHYCVDRFGYMKLWHLLNDGSSQASHPDQTEGIVFYKKIPIHYNPKLDGGFLDDNNRAKSADGETSQTISEEPGS